MQVTQEQVSPCEVALNIEVEVEKVNAAIDETYRELGKRVNVPGFRKGKAPRVILEQYLDEEKVKDEVADRLIEPAYAQALEETKIEPFGAGDVEVIKLEAGEAMVFKITVPLEPKVELGEYTGLKIERNISTVTDEQVEEEIKGILERQAEYTQITDREVKEGDTVVVEMKNDSEPDEEPKRNVTEAGKNLPDFDKGLIGMKIDEEKVIEITYPEDFGAEELRGKTVPLKTKIIELHEKKLPELTDDWVKENLGKQEEGAEPNPDVVDTVDKLRAKIREAMEKAAEDVANADVENKIVKQIVENSTICFPSALVKEKVNDRFRSLLDELEKRKVTFEAYIKHVGTTFEDLKSQYEEEAKGTLEVMFALHEVIKKEDIKVEDADVDAEIQTMSESRGVPVETIRAYLDSTEGLETIKNRILHKKIMDFLVNASNINNVG